MAGFASFAVFLASFALAIAITNHEFINLLERFGQ